MKIKNFKDLAVTKEREMVLKIAEAGLEAIDTRRSIKNKIKLEGDRLEISGKDFNLKDYKNIFVVAIGKCALDAASALEEILGNKIKDGIALDIREGKLKKIKAFAGDHPLPSGKNVEATKKLIEFLKKTEKDDLVLAVVSGGGSALLCQPEGMAPGDEAFIIRRLFDGGANIYKLNILRKHLSRARGGFLAEYAYPSTVISLIFSDVPGDDVGFISSGPTVKDSSTISDAQAIIKEFSAGGELDKFSKNLIETPKDDKFFKKSENFIIASNSIALEAMADFAKKKGLASRICGNCLTGEASSIGEWIIKELESQNSSALLLYGGETTVTARGSGIGGRNQELALSGLRFVKEGELLLTLASDGRDNTDHAGAICDIITKEKSKKLKLDIESFLANNDSYNFFSKTGGYLSTGNTGSNVSDLIIAYKFK